MGERLNGIQEVGGSIPPGSTIRFTARTTRDLGVSGPCRSIEPIPLSWNRLFVIFVAFSDGEPVSTSPENALASPADAPHRPPRGAIPSLHLLVHDARGPFPLRLDALGLQYRRSAGRVGFGDLAPGLHRLLGGRGLKNNVNGAPGRAPLGGSGGLREAGFARRLRRRRDGHARPKAQQDCRHTRVLESVTQVERLEAGATKKIAERQPSLSLRGVG